MSPAFITDFISMLLLIVAGYVVWRQRRHFRTLVPLIPATVFIAVGRIGDMLVERPNLIHSELFGLSSNSLHLIFAVTGNIADVIGISILIYGFLNIVRFEKTEEKLITDLEKLLPICASCKKYRTEDGHWLPIEKYLRESGGPAITHSVCPECWTKLYGDLSVHGSGVDA